MKKYLKFAVFSLLTIVLILPFSVSAKTKAGTKPGSFFYFFDKAFEKADLFFTFSTEKKAKKVLENAEERLAEAEESASENDQKAVETAMKDYQENISLAETEVKLIKDEIKTKELLSNIASSTSKHQEILEKVLTKVPEGAKEAITKAIEADKERREEMTKKIEEINNEIKKEDNDFKKDEEEKSNDDVGDNESDKEKVENENKDENKKGEQKKEIEKLKKEVETLKQKQPQVKIIEKITEKEKPIIIEKKENSSSQISSQTKQNENIVTLPNGAVVEMDANGNVVRTIKEAPKQVYTPQTTDNITSLAVSIGVIKITSSSAHIEWKTNIPTDSKIFLNQPDGSIKVISSASGNSTMHFVDISSLISGTLYNYTIEAINDTQSKKIDGSFTTNQQTFIAELVKSSINTNDTAPFLKLSSDRPFTIKKLVFLDDGAYCRSGYSFAVLSLQYSSVSKDAKKELVNSMGRFVFDFPDGLTSSGITFRLTAGTESLQSSSCIYDGMKFILRDSESIIFGENGQQIEVLHLILMGK